MSVMRLWNVAIVGSGNNARVHVEGALRHPDRVKLVAIVDPDAGRREAFSEKHGIDRTYTPLVRHLVKSMIIDPIFCRARAAKNA